MVGQLVKRNLIMALESHIQGVDTHTNWVDRITHTFAQGTYSREMKMQAGDLVVGKIHRYSCFNFLMYGSVRVESEFESDVYEGPITWVSSPGTKRAVHVLTPARWITVHENPTNTRDMGEIEKHLIAESYDALEKL